MTAPNGNVCPTKFWFAFLAILLLAGIAIVLVEPFQAVKGNTAVGAPGDVNLQLKDDDWFSLVDDVAEKNIAVESARVGGSQFTLEAKRIDQIQAHAHRAYERRSRSRGHRSAGNRSNSQRPRAGPGV
jgi:hypothetical protein